MLIKSVTHANLLVEEAIGKPRPLNDSIRRVVKSKTVCSREPCFTCLVKDEIGQHRPAKFGIAAVILSLNVHRIVQNDNAVGDGHEKIPSPAGADFGKVTLPQHLFSRSSGSSSRRSSACIWVNVTKTSVERRHDEPPRKPRNAEHIATAHLIVAEVADVTVLFINEPQSFACANGFPWSVDAEAAYMLLAAVKGSIAVRFHRWIAVKAMSHAVAVKTKE